MANPEWPEALPRAVLAGWTETFANQQERAKNDRGADKVRRATTSKPKQFRGAIPMTAAQLEIFEDFFDNDLSGGVKSFDFVHPRTKEIRVFRFLDSDPEAAHKGADLYHLSLTLELFSR